MLEAAREDGLPWRFVQSFGDDNSSDDDLVTAVEFDINGNYLAVGDKAGRICVFEAQNKRSDGSSSSEYKFYTEFQSHEPEFDCLKSLEIEEKINMIKWGKANNGLFLLASNDKTIKLWKVHEKKMKRPVRSNRKDVSAPNNVFKIPKLSHFQTVTTSACKRTFLSSDDLRINLWHLDDNSESFTVVDIKPPNLEELTEVITCANFHPSQCNIMLYGSSRGSIRLADLRDSALCDQHSKVFAAEDEPNSKNFFTEITNSVSDVKVAENGRYIISRDFLTLKLWDVNMESRPVATVQVHDYLSSHLCDLYENDCIFDKFECSVSSQGKDTRVVTGSYDNNFIIHNFTTQKTTTMEVMKSAKRRPKTDKKASALPTKSGVPKAGESKESEVDLTQMDFTKKAQHVAWHPLLNTVAVAGCNKLYIYDASGPLTSGMGAISSRALGPNSPSSDSMTS